MPPPSGGAAPGAPVDFAAALAKARAVCATAVEEILGRERERGRERQREGERKRKKATESDRKRKRRPRVA